MLVNYQANPLQLQTIQQLAAPYLPLHLNFPQLPFPLLYKPNFSNGKEGLCKVTVLGCDSKQSFNQNFKETVSTFSGKEKCIFIFMPATIRLSHQTYKVQNQLFLHIQKNCSKHAKEFLLSFLISDEDPHKKLLHLSINSFLIHLKRYCEQYVQRTLPQLFNSYQAQIERSSQLNLSKLFGITESIVLLLLQLGQGQKAKNYLDGFNVFYKTDKASTKNQVILKINQNLAPKLLLNFNNYYLTSKMAVSIMQPRLIIQALALFVSKLQFLKLSVDQALNRLFQLLVLLDQEKLKYAQQLQNQPAYHELLIAFSLTKIQSFWHIAFLQFQLPRWLKTHQSINLEIQRALTQPLITPASGKTGFWTFDNFKAVFFQQILSMLKKLQGSAQHRGQLLKLSLTVLKIKRYFGLAHISINIPSELWSELFKYPNLELLYLVYEFDLRKAHDNLQRLLASSLVSLQNKKLILQILPRDSTGPCYLKSTFGGELKAFRFVHLKGFQFRIQFQLEQLFASIAACQFQHLRVTFVTQDRKQLVLEVTAGMNITLNYRGTVRLLKARIYYDRFSFPLALTSSLMAEQIRVRTTWIKVTTNFEGGSTIIPGVWNRVRVQVYSEQEFEEVQLSWQNMVGLSLQYKDSPIQKGQKNIVYQAMVRLIQDDSYLFNNDFKVTAKLALAGALVKSHSVRFQYSKLTDLKVQLASSTAGPYYLLSNVGINPIRIKDFQIEPGEKMGVQNFTV